MGNENAVSARETLAHEEEDPTIDNEGAYHVSELKRYAPLLPLIAGLACSRRRTECIGILELRADRRGIHLGRHRARRPHRFRAATLRNNETE